MGVNADQFNRELKQELEAKEQEFVSWRADLVADMLSVAERLTPQKTGKTRSRWGAGTSRVRFGAKDPRWRAEGSEAARAFLRTIRTKDTVFAGNVWFVSGFLEKGTRRGVRGRHMLRRGIESVRGREKK